MRELQNAVGIYFPSLVPALPRKVIFDVVEVVEKLIEQSPSATTVFAFSDSLLKEIGRPSLNLFRFHLASFPLIPSRIRLLTIGAKIPSSSDHLTSIKNIKLTQTPAYDDDFLLVYDVDEFFDRGFPFMNQRLISSDHIGECL
ncbi:hypothetical protein ACSQ67_026308 [Phaseolus vulgaris]